MKSSGSIAISLTLLMFILVLAAAVFFLMQGQQTLKGELSTSDENIHMLENQQAKMELSEQAAHATLEVAQDLQATSAVENLDLEGQLSDTAQAKATLEAVSTDQASELENANSKLSNFESQGPVVTIVEPQANANLIIDQPIEIVIVAADPNGVKSISYNTDKDLHTEEVEVQPVVTLRKTWTPTVPGTFTITASAVNNNEKLSQPSQFSNVTINVIPAPTDTPEPTKEPTIEPTPET